VKGVMFRTSLRTLRFAPKDGLRVVARGRVTVYDPKGEYQIVCEHFEPEGLGARQLAFEQLKARLTAEGLFAAERKRPITELPRKVGRRDVARRARRYGTSSTSSAGAMPTCTS
jgi:exodeoxyribonuclease VII large subunit